MQASTRSSCSGLRWCTGKRARGCEQLAPCPLSTCISMMSSACSAMAALPDAPGDKGASAGKLVSRFERQRDWPVEDRSSVPGVWARLALGHLRTQRRHFPRSHHAVLHDAPLRDLRWCQELRQRQVYGLWTHRAPLDHRCIAQWHTCKGYACSALCACTWRIDRHTPRCGISHPMCAPLTPTVRRPSIRAAAQRRSVQVFAASAADLNKKFGESPGNAHPLPHFPGL